MSRKPERIFGRIPVLESLRAGKRSPRRLFFYANAKGLEAIRAAAGNLPVEAVTRDELDRLSQGQLHQGVVLETTALPRHRLEDWLNTPACAKDAIVVLLDSIEDPHNFGAVIRSASALGVSGVIFAKDRSAPLSPAATKAAAGAMEYIDLIQVTNLARSIRSLQDNGFWVASLEADATQDLWQANFTGRIALVIGSEGKGTRRLVRERCDFSLRIPLTGPITSLNASVSAAIALTECARQRSGNAPPAKG